MRTVHDISALENVPVLVRTSMNVPVENGVVTNDYRLRRAAPTIQFLAERGARVILISHIGRKGTETLEPIADALGKFVPNISFFGETVGPRAREAVRNLSPGHVLVLENLRRNAGEKGNDSAFAKELAMLADVFVQDSFDTCHRAHASIVGVPKFLPSYAGLQLVEEIKELSLGLKPKHPGLAIIGGAKFATKEAVLSRLLLEYDKVFIGGALTNDFLRVQGHEVGQSLISGTGDDAIKKLLENDKVILPVDSLVVSADRINTPDEKQHARVAGLDDVHGDEVILDHGPATSELLATLVAPAKTILWNGPLGNYENGFVDATDALAQAIAASRAHSIVGGGDTIASIESLGLLSEFSFVSTGGGAMLDFLTDGTLAGIEALG